MPKRFAPSQTSAVSALRPGVGPDFQRSAADAAALLKAMASPSRLMLLCHLIDAELGVTELGERAGLVQPSLSQQLAVLRRERLVSTRRVGKNVVYRIDSPAVLAVLQTLDALFCRPPAAPQSRSTALRATSQTKEIS